VCAWPEADVLLLLDVLPLLELVLDWLSSLDDEYGCALVPLLPVLDWPWAVAVAIAGDEALA
jgi:hypothetical protein